MQAARYCTTLGCGISYGELAKLLPEAPLHVPPETRRALGRAAAELELASALLARGARKTAGCAADRSATHGMEASMGTHFEYDVSYNCRALVHVGRQTAIVQRLEQSLTYAGLLEGFPTRKSNDHLLNWLRSDAGPAGVVLIEPARRDFLRRPGDMSSLSTIRDEPPEWLPMVKVSMTLHASADSVDHRSVLRVIFFQDDFAPPLDDSVAAALRRIDWEGRARLEEI